MAAALTACVAPLTRIRNRETASVRREDTEFLPCFHQRLFATVEDRQVACMHNVSILFRMSIYQSNLMILRDSMATNPGVREGDPG
jgi:hypothetical protein